MQCTVLIPHLWWPDDAEEGARQEPVLRELQILLSRARRKIFPPTTPETWLCQAFGVARQTDWPIAPLTLMADGGEPRNDYWLRADPVHLRLRRDRLFPVDSTALAVTGEEADALAGVLDRYFATEGMRFSAPHPERWYLRLEADPEIATRSPGEPAGGGVDPSLPSGTNALRWHRVCNEIQMLLHEHPVNAAREQRGEPVINGVWLWGGGRLPAVSRECFSGVCGDEPLAVALAAAAGVPAHPMTADGARWVEHSRAAPATRGGQLLVLNQLAPAATRGDAALWQQSLADLNRCWLAPLLDALGKRTLSGLTLIATGNAGCCSFEISPRDLWRFWRRQQPIHAYRPPAGN